MGLVYSSEVPGIGEVIQSATPITVPTGIILTHPSFEFATKASFATEADYLSAIVAGTMFPVQGIIESEPWDFEDKVQETSIGQEIFQFPGTRGWKLKVVLSLEQHKNLREYSFINWRVLMVDVNNNIQGYDPDGTKVKGLKVSYFRVGKMGSPSANSAAVTPIEFKFAHIEEWDKKGIMVNPTWLASDLTGVLDVDLTCGAVAANSCTGVVAYKDDSQLTGAGAQASIPITSLAAANFLLMHGETEITAGKTVTESSTVPGTYTIAATSLVATDTVKVQPSTTQLYKSDAETLAA
jgi:hypothetical protein